MDIENLRQILTFLGVTISLLIYYLDNRKRYEIHTIIKSKTETVEGIIGVSNKTEFIIEIYNKSKKTIQVRLLGFVSYSIKNKIFLKLKPFKEKVLSDILFLNIPDDLILGVGDYKRVESFEKITLKKIDVEFLIKHLRLNKPNTNEFLMVFEEIEGKKLKTMKLRIRK